MQEEKLIRRTLRLFESLLQYLRRGTVTRKNSKQFEQIRETFYGYIVVA